MRLVAHVARAASATVLAILLVGCGTELDGFTRTPVDTNVPTIDEDWQPVSRVDEGTFCFFEEEGRLRLEVSAADCVTDRCVRNVATSCAMTEKSGVITTTSELTWEHDASRTCTAACEHPTATCYLSTPPKGLYAVLVGTAHQNLDIPTKGACLTFGSPK